MMNGAEGISLDLAGNIYVSGYYSDNVFRLSPPSPPPSVPSPSPISITRVGALVGAVGSAGLEPIVDVRRQNKRFELRSFV